MVIAPSIASHRIYPPTHLPFGLCSSKLSILQASSGSWVQRPKNCLLFPGWMPGPAIIWSSPQPLASLAGVITYYDSIPPCTGFFPIQSDLTARMMPHTTFLHHPLFPTRWWDDDGERSGSIDLDRFVRVGASHGVGSCRGKGHSSFVQSPAFRLLTLDQS